MRLAVGFVVGLGLLGCAGLMPKPGYRSEGTLVLDPVDTDRAAYLATQATVATSVTLKERTAERLRFDPAEVEVSAEPDEAGWTLRIAVTGADPKRVTEWCNALLEGMIERRMEERRIEMDLERSTLLRELDQAAGDAPRTIEVRRRIEDLEARWTRIDLRVLDSCRLPTSPGP